MEPSSFDLAKTNEASARRRQEEAHGIPPSLSHLFKQIQPVAAPTNPASIAADPITPQLSVIAELASAMLPNPDLTRVPGEGSSRTGTESTWSERPSLILPDWATLEMAFPRRELKLLLRTSGDYAVHLIGPEKGVLLYCNSKWETVEIPFLIQEG